jgi:hypothetical protein
VPQLRQFLREQIKEIVPSLPIRAIPSIYVVLTKRQGVFRNAALVDVLAHHAEVVEDGAVVKVDFLESIAVRQDPINLGVVKEAEVAQGESLKTREVQGGEVQLRVEAEVLACVERQVLERGRSGVQPCAWELREELAYFGELVCLGRDRSE